MCVCVCVSLRIRGPLRGVATRVERILADFGEFPKVVGAKGRFTLLDPMALARHAPRPPAAAPPVHLVPASKKLPKSLLTKAAKAKEDHETLISAIDKVAELPVAGPVPKVVASEPAHIVREWGPRPKIRRLEDAQEKAARHVEADRMGVAWLALERRLAEMAMSEDTLETPKLEPAGPSSSSSTTRA